MNERATETLDDVVGKVGPAAAFSDNLRAYAALRMLDRPDGVHNRESRRRLAKELRRRLGQRVVQDFAAMGRQR